MNREEKLKLFLAEAELETQAIRGGQERSQHGEHAEAMYLTSSYVFESAAGAAARFSGEDKGNVYTRYTNPTVANFEQRLALMVFHCIHVSLLQLPLTPFLYVEN